jgi:hypothetical protein
MNTLKYLKVKRLSIYKDFEEGPEIAFSVSCIKCKYLEYYEGSQKGPYIEKAKCLKNNKIIYDSVNQEYEIYNYETPNWCPIIEGEKLNNIVDILKDIEIKK